MAPTTRHSSVNRPHSHKRRHLTRNIFATLLTPTLFLRPGPSPCCNWLDIGEGVCLRSLCSWWGRPWAVCPTTRVPGYAGLAGGFAPQPGRPDLRACTRKRIVRRRRFDESSADKHPVRGLLRQSERFKPVGVLLTQFAETLKRLRTTVCESSQPRRRGLAASVCWPQGSHLQPRPLPSGGRDSSPWSSLTSGPVVPGLPFTSTSSSSAAANAAVNWALALEPFAAYGDGGAPSLRVHRARVGGGRAAGFDGAATHGRYVVHALFPGQCRTGPSCATRDRRTRRAACTRFVGRARGSRRPGPVEPWYSRSQRHIAVDSPCDVCTGGSRPGLADMGQCARSSRSGFRWEAA